LADILISRICADNRKFG